jgi:hypothetical protein
VVSPPFELTRSDFGTTTGTYYAFNQSADVITPENAAGHIFINIPSVALDVVLNTSLMRFCERKIRRPRQHPGLQGG